MRRHVLAALGLVAALGLAACGGGATALPAPATAVPSIASTPAPTAGGEATPAVTTGAAATGAVTIANFAFAPATVTVKAGGTVTWTNTDSATHTVKWSDGAAGSGPLTSGGASYTRTFATPGTFAYACGIHPSMKGAIVVEP